MALDHIEEEIPLATIVDNVAMREMIVSSHFDPGEAQAFAVAEVHDGRLLTDDTFAFLSWLRRTL